MFWVTKLETRQRRPTLKSAKAILDLMSFFVQMVKNVLEAVESFETMHDARSLESYIEAQAKVLGVVMMELCWKIRMQERPLPVSLACACGHVKHRKGKRSRELRTVMGTMTLEERHGYRCDRCGSAEYWGDDLRGATDFSQLAEDRLAFMGKDGAFEQSSEALKHLGLFDVAGSTIRDVCMRLANRLRAQTDHQAAQQHCTEEVRAEEKPAGLAISVDGVMLGRVDPQHRRRKSKSGKVRGKKGLKHFFHEVKTLVIFEFNKKGEALRKTYQATQERVEDFREKVALEAIKRGAQSVKLLVFLGDGAPWVWRTASELFPRAIQVLDWYHAMEHVWATGRARFGAREKELWAWVAARETELWNGKIEAVIAALKAVSADLGAPDSSLSDTAKATDPRWIAFRNIGYFRDNQQRMNYPDYRAKGLPIGSGVVESACKHVVASRLKRAGMRWDESGAENVMALRCHYLNGRWDSLWQQKKVS
jgi:hypothetical protein